MRVNIYAIRDKAAGIYLTPFIINRNDVTPIREFQSIVNNPESIMNQHAADFELHNIGTVDLEEGNIAGYPSVPLTVVITGLEITNAAKD